MNLGELDYHDYYDSGCGKPYKERELINFCQENIDKFSNIGAQQDPYCNECKKKGLNDTYIFDFYDHKADYELIAKYVSNLDSFKDIPEEIASITVLVCDKCNKWFITI